MGGTRTGCSTPTAWDRGGRGSISGHLQAAGRSELTIRSYGMDLLRWFRFLWAIGVPWSRAVRSRCPGFLPVAAGRGETDPAALARAGRAGAGQPAAGSSVAYSPSVRAHCETVLRSFYDFHLEAGTGPLVNPFPLDRSRRGGRANAHHNPMEPFRNERSGLYRPVMPSRIPRDIPDEEFNEIFAALGRTGTGRWSRSMCPPGHGRRSCCWRPGAGWTRAAADLRGP